MITLDQSWKERRNDISNLTVAQLIENTIREEVDRNILRNVFTGNNTKTQYEIIEEGYLQGIAILNEVM